MSQPITYKVFVGNLSFKTKAQELAGEFSAAGKVIGANIISRGPRSLGYGFVEMESEDAASKAVTLLNKKNVDGREINVEIARPRDESARPPQAPRQNQNGSFGGGRGGAPSRGGPRGGRVDRGGRGGGLRGGFRGGRGGRGGRFPRTVEVGAPQEGQANNNVRANNNNNNAPAPQQNDEQGQQQGGQRRNQRPRSNSRRGGRGGRFQRQPREPREDNRNPSTTTLFVANLPYSLTDATLLDLFKAQNPVKAHVVLNKYGRSKGFGFVEFANQEGQTAALNAEKKTVENRELSVKIALTENPRPEASTSAAAAASSPATEATTPAAAATEAKSN